MKYKTPPINEYSKHRWKCIWKRKALGKLQLDLMNKDLIEETSIGGAEFHTFWQGEYAKQLARKERNKKRLWNLLWIMMVVGFIIGLIL